MLKIINHQFWIDRELAKVKDAERKKFLVKQFSGKAGIDLFWQMMRERKGAIEFKNGTWAPTLKIPSDIQIQKRKRLCIACHDYRIIEFTPLGEIYEDFWPVCPNCINITTKNNTMANHIENIQKLIAEKNKANENINNQIQAEKDGLITELKKSLTEAKVTFNLLTSAEVGHSANEVLADAEIIELLKPFIGETPKRKPADTAGSKKSDGKKSTRDWIIEVLTKSKESLTRPEMESAIKKASGRKEVFNVYYYVTKLVKEKVLATDGKNKFKIK